MDLAKLKEDVLQYHAEQVGGRYTKEIVRRHNKCIDTLTATCEKQAKHISEQGAEIERLREIMWATIWEENARLKEELEHRPGQST